MIAATACVHDIAEGNLDAGEEDYCILCGSSRKDIRIAELEAQVAKLRSEQHEAQRVYRRLLTELEEKL